MWKVIGFGRSYTKMIGEIGEGVFAIAGSGKTDIIQIEM
jgi:hypothetical protein